jgi:16S rRNA (guanine527-N7)-methyltransferase
MSQIEFQDRLKLTWPTLSSVQFDKISQFYQLVITENEVQNLTRLISPSDFLSGHVLDVIELQRSGLVDYPAMDLGSGPGVPGLLSAIVDGKPWILTDSEGRKSAFLSAAAQKIGLLNVQVFGKRAEDVLKTSPVQSVVARAVGPVGRIFTWIERCSTWNSLILLKGPGWEAEWEAFQQETKKKKLQIVADHFYEVGEDKKQRHIIKLKRI